MKFPKITPQQLDDWRVIPRVMVLCYGLICYKVSMWFMALPDPNSQQSMFASAVLGAAAAWFGFYVNTDRNKGQN